MVAGKRALADYRSRYENIKRISAMLCTPQLETADTLEKYISDSEASKSALKQARIKIAELEAERVEYGQGNRVVYHPDFSIPELIAFSNAAIDRIDGILVAISGAEGDYKYVISSRNVDLRTISKDINAALSGRGGGRPEMIQGSFNTTLEKIKDYFK
jgi:alanyl-tRNA synthetase